MKGSSMGIVVIEEFGLELALSRWENSEAPLYGEGM